MGQHRTGSEQQVESQHLGGSRNVRISLPPGYEKNTRRRYPVLYLHDGQNVFSGAGPDCCFGWGNWELDLTATRLAATDKMADIILVGIDNSRARYSEYRGPAFRSHDKEATHSTRAGDDSHFHNYSAFLIKELKPFIDREFRTRPAPEYTGLMGASLGGICSLAMAWQHPGVFGLAASLSGSFHIERTYFLHHVLHGYRGKRKPIRIYLDSGVVDSAGDDDGCEITDALAAELRRSGWKEGKTLLRYLDEKPMTEAELAIAGLRHDKWHEATASQHNEFYWRQRIWRPLTFLYPPTK